MCGEQQLGGFWWFYPGTNGLNSLPPPSDKSCISFPTKALLAEVLDVCVHVLVELQAWIIIN